MILNKFAAGVVATAIGLTAISAPVKADEDFNKLIALLAGGLIVSEIIKDKKEDKQVVKREKTRRDTSYTHRHKDGTWHTHKSYEHAKRYHEKQRKIVGRRPNPEVYFPIQDRITKLPMPKACGRIISRHNAKNIKAMSKNCLLKHHYRISKKGVVSNPKYPSRYAYPNLIQ